MPAITFDDIALTNIKRYPLSEPADLYKLCHQAAMGSEHAVENSAAARAWLDRELGELAHVPAPQIDEPLIQPITPDGRIVRVNLRPFLSAGGSPEDLLQAFVQTANRKWGDGHLLRQYWGCFVKLAEQGKIPHQPQFLANFIAAKSANGYSAVHHSQVYRQAYRPSYRVIAGAYLPDIIPA